MRKYFVCLTLCLLAFPLRGDWVRAGLYGADVRALIVHPASPDTIFLGTSQGEVYSSNDGGVSWRNPWGGIPFPGYVVDNLAMDSRGQLWVAGWGLWEGGVIAMSADGGVTWSRRDAGLEKFSVRALAIAPQDPNFLVAGGLTGVHRSVDGGKVWEKISDQINVESLAVDPRDTNRIFVGTWRQAFRTSDGGKNWELINKGMVLDTDVFSIHIDPKNPDNIWASTCGWVYNSTDSGDSWTRYKDGFNNRRIHDVDIDPSDANCVYAGSVGGLYRSLDLGKKWELISDESLVINAIGLHPQKPKRLVLGIEGDGVYISHDSGKTFQRSNQGLFNVRVAAVVPDPRQRGRLYAAVLFGGAASGLYESPDAGASWKRINRTRLPEILSLVIQRDSDPKFVAGTEKGFFWSQDGVEWTQAEPVATPLRVEKIISYNASRLFAATAEGVFTSKDAGKSWYRLAGIIERSVDLAVGTVGEQRALYALTSAGLRVFDGEKWFPIVGAPTRGKSLAIRREGETETVVISSFQGVRGGHIDFAKRWHDTSVSQRAYTSVLQSQTAEATLFLGSAEPRKVFVAANGPKSVWTPLLLPIDSKEVLSLAIDGEGRYFLGTGGQGIFIHREPKKSAGDRVPVYLGGSK